LFPNTQFDKGECPKSHDVHLKKMFEDDSEEKRNHYERRYVSEAIDYIDGKLNEIEVKIKKNK